TADGRDVPRYLIPRAGRPGERVRLHLRDLDLKPGSEIVLQVRAVDGSGNVGAPLSGTVRVSDRVALDLPGATPAVFGKPAPLPRLGAADVAVIDELDKVHALTGE